MTSQPDASHEQQRTQMYMNGLLPTNLPEYLREFAPDEKTEIFPGHEIATCAGVGGYSQNFLTADGYNQCVNCQIDVCSTCHIEEEHVIYCLPCFAQHSFVPNVGDQSAMQVSAMREELRERWNTANVDELTVEEVEGLYEKREVATARINEMLCDVPFPLHPSREIDSESPEGWDVLCDIDLEEGASFLLDSDLDPVLLLGILGMFSELVRFNFGVKRTDNQQDPEIYNSLPEVFINYTHKSCLYGGFRLNL
jgi:hypothetical protein